MSIADQNLCTIHVCNMLRSMYVHPLKQYFGFGKTHAVEINTKLDFLEQVINV